MEIFKNIYNLIVIIEFIARPSKVKQSLNHNNNNTEMKTASNNNNNDAITCCKCQVFDKPNIQLFLWHECGFDLCGDCYQKSYWTITK